MKSKFTSAGWLLGLAALLLGGMARAEERMTVLTVDMTKEGKKITPPTPEHPTYYVPVYLGYSERGEDQAQHFQRKPVSEEVIQQSVVSALARQGYKIASHEFPPTMTIAFECGSISPVRIGRRVINAEEIRGLVLGSSVRDLVGQGAGYTPEMLSLTPRHFLVISAYEYQRSSKNKPDVLLWRAHSTTDAWGNYYDEVAKLLITTAEPVLGRQTRPGASWSERTGRVIIGTPEVKEDHAEREKTK